MKTRWIQILQWKKYNNPRKDVKSTSWYRMQNDFLEHPDFFDLDNDQRLVWPYLLGKASPKMCAVVKISLAHAAAILKSTPERVLETIEYFQSKRLLAVLASPEEALDESDDDSDELEEQEEAAEEQLETLGPQGRNESVPDTLRARNESVPDTSRKLPVTERNGTERNEEKQTRARKPKPERIITWEPDDPLGKVFENLVAIPAYLAVFDREHDRKTVQAHITHHGLNVADMERVTFELRNYCDGLKEPIKSPRGKLSTFVQNFAERKAKQQAPPPPKPKSRMLTAEDLHKW